MTRTSAEVERDVDATRHEIDRTVEALKAKLQPRELMDEATRIMSATSRKTGMMMMDHAKQNSIPLALIAAGIAWMAFGRWQRTTLANGYVGVRPYDTYEGYQDEDGAGRKLKARVDGAVSAAKDAMSDAREKFSGAVDHAKDGLSDVRTQAAERADEAKSRVSAMAHTLQDRAGDMRQKAQQTYQDTLDSEPLVIGAIGLAVGAAIAASLPGTPLERRYVGPTRDRLLGRGKDIAQSSLGDVKDVAERAYGQVKDEIHRQTGPEGAGRTFAEKAEAIAEAGVQAVRDEVDNRSAH